MLTAACHLCFCYQWEWQHQLCLFDVILLTLSIEWSCIQIRNKLCERREKSRGRLAGRGSRVRRNRLVTWSVQDSPQSECRPAVTPRQGMLMTHPPMSGLPTQQVHLPRGRKGGRSLDTAPCSKK